jgi:hypothetical protein
MHVYIYDISSTNVYVALTGKSITQQNLKKDKTVLGTFYLSLMTKFVLLHFIRHLFCLYL